MRLGDIIEIKHGYAFSGDYIIEEDNNIVLVTPGNFRIGGGFQEKKCKFFDGEIPSDYILKEGDFIVTMTDLSKTIDTLGYSAIIPKSDSRIYLHNQRIGLVSFKNDICDSGYIYWLMRTREYQRTIANTSTGSTVHHTSPSKIYDYAFDAPDKATQYHIATILSRYDSLIENYQKQIKLLEESAQRLYKEWFIDLRFPGHENTKIVDGVPEGWEKKKINEIALLKAGGDKPEIVSENRTKICNIPIYSNGTSNEGLYGYTDKPEITEHCITISARGSVGYTVMRRKPFVPIVRLISVIPQSIYVGYLYFYTKQIPLDSNGAAQQQITIPMIRDKEIIIPTNFILDELERCLEPMFKHIDDLKSLIRHLTEARDRLLPKLMSEEIKIN